MNQKYHAIVFLSWLAVSLMLISFSKTDISGTLRGSYFGQTPPGLTPEKFAPGIISTDEDEQNGVFSPDGKEFYFTKVTKEFEFIPFRVKITDHEYGKAEKCDIYDTYQAGEIFVSPNGDKLFFRATISQTPPNADIFCQLKTEEGWGEAFNVGSPVNSDGIEGYPSVSSDGTLYFYARREDSIGNFDLYSSRYENGKYVTPENLGSGINTRYNEFNPCISPDGSYIIFNSGDRPGNLGKGHDLYISFRKDDGSWGEAVHMGKDINSPESDYSAVVSADGKFVFFSSRRNPDRSADIYWFDADYVKELRRRICPYLGQLPPGLTPEIFAPGAVSSQEHRELGGGTFSPDGKEFYFTRDIDNDWVIMVCRWESQGWTIPEQVKFSEGHTALEPHVTLDNRSIYWVWRGLEDKGMYMAKRTADGWSEPEYAGPGMMVSSTRDGQMFVTDTQATPVRIAQVEVENGRFIQFKRLKGEIEKFQDENRSAHPCVPPDGSYLIFDKDATHMYVSFRKNDNEWGQPIDLTRHGFDLEAGIASISPDGKYLFFKIKGDIYWVSTKIIEKLRPDN